MRELLKNSIAKSILSAIAVAFFGSILLNLTFLFDVLYQSAIRGIVGLFIPLGPDMKLYWFPPLMHASFVLVIFFISWIVFRSKLGVLYKAIYLTVPVAVVLTTVGIFLYRWPIVSYSVGSLLCIGALYYLYRIKQPWLYYYTVILVGITLAIFTLLGGEI
jgi:hypothetical protein